LEEFEVGGVGGGVEAAGGGAGLDAFGDEILVGGHFGGFGGEFSGEMGGQDDGAVGVADDDVAGEDGSVAAGDGGVDVDGLVEGEVGGGAGAVVVAMDGEF